MPTHYLLHPRAPLVFGTGRPLSFGLGGDSHPFPFPGSVAGALRAAVQMAADEPPDPFANSGTALLALGLARFNWLDAAAVPELLFPRPSDVVYLNGKMLRLRPVPVPAGCYTDLAEGLQLLKIEGSEQDLKGKPDDAPQWWTAATLGKWLANPSDLCNGQPVREHFDSRPDPRTHVVVDPLGKGAVTGGLFRSTGRDFGPQDGSSMGFALAVATNSNALHGQARRLGGEGRFVRFEQHPAAAWSAPAVPSGLTRATRIRLVLTTPAVFVRNGWYPDTFALVNGAIQGRILLADGSAVEATLVAAAITRAQSYSGWQRPDAPGGQGKPGRPHRVVPAGSVYWIDVPEGSAPKLWGQSLCEGQWALDGWGRCLAGIA